ncbi:MAG TPA: ATP-binding cassette domain-containing protein, partial [Acidimicrobiales bacterium]|nr:ATP-binding cassette domain-containing protein [Acidimicrobiales bacterium]
MTFATTPPAEAPADDGLPCALELTGVRAAYGRIEVIHGVDLSVASGTVLAVLGPNGAGKSTLLKVMGGRMRPSSGSVRVEGATVGRHEGAESL